MLKIIAGVAIGLVIYSYLAYPILLAAVATVVQMVRGLPWPSRKGEPRPVPARAVPTVAVVFSAFNEEAHVRQRIENLLALDYPEERLTIHVGSDGSTDRTAAILAECASDRVRICAFEENRGKASVLNDLVARVTAEIIVFTDANVRFDRTAVRRLVEHFDDARMGAVSGELRLLSPGGENQDSLYWRIEQVLKRFESRIGALLGANGAIYAIRRSRWTPLAPDTICDDFCVAMNIAAAGYRLDYEPAAWAEEESPPAIRDEYRRRVRIGIGNFQSLFQHPSYLTRTSFATAVCYVSHKILRWVAPYLLIIGLVCSLAAIDSRAWAWFAGVQVLGYLVAGGAYLASSRGWPLPRALRIPGFLFALNWAFLVASIRYLSGDFRGSWQRTQR